MGVYFFRKTCGVNTIVCFHVGCVHGLNSWEKTSSVGIEEAISSMLNLCSVYSLHPPKLSIEQCLFFIHVLKLPQNGVFDEVDLLLESTHFSFVRVQSFQGVLQVLSESFQIDICVSLDRLGQLIDD